MEPHIEHTFYTWIIVVSVVCIATFIGAVIDRVRLIHAQVNQIRKRHAEAKLSSQHAPEHVK